MGLDDLLIKKYAKKYLRQTLNNILEEPKKPLLTKNDIVEYLAEKAEILYEKWVMK